MRPYRGLTKEGKWVYGWYVPFTLPIEESPRYKIEHRIYTHLGRADCTVFYEVLPETVGQSIGLKDKNDKNGYDCDKVSFGEIRLLYQIKWSVCNAEFYLESMDDKKEVLHISHLIVGGIIGNTHENPELLKDQQ